MEIDDDEIEDFDAAVAENAAALAHELLRVDLAELKRSHLTRQRKRPQLQESKLGRLAETNREFDLHGCARSLGADA